MDQRIDEPLTEGAIKLSPSPLASPAVLVEKKDNVDGPRFCGDYTEITKKDSFLIPRIRDIFDQQQGAKIFSTLDLKCGFRKISIHLEDQEKTAFRCHWD